MNIESVNKSINDLLSRYKIKDNLKLIDFYNDEDNVGSLVLIWEVNNKKCYRSYPETKLECYIQFFIDGFIIGKLESHNRIIL